MGARAARAHGRSRARAAGAAEPRTQRPGLCGRRARLPVLWRADDLEPDAVERADGRRHAAARRRRRPPRRLRLRLPLRSVRRHGRRRRRRRRRRRCRRRRRADPPRARAQYECERALRLLRDARGGGGRCAAHRGVAQRARRVELHGGVHLLPAAPSRRALAEFGPRRRRHRRRARRSQLQRARIAARLPLRRAGGAARLRLAERAPARVRPRWPARRARRARTASAPPSAHGLAPNEVAATVVNATLVRCTSPPQWSGAYDEAAAFAGARGGPFVGTPPPAPPATVALELSLNGHDFTAAALNFTYYAAAPSVSRIWPRSDTAAGGRAVTVHGAGLGGGSPMALPLRAGASAGGARGAARRPPRRVPHAAALPRGRLDARRSALRLPAWRRRWRRRRVPGGAATLDHAQRPAVHGERPDALSSRGAPPLPLGARPATGPERGGTDVVVSGSVSRTARGTSAPLARRAARRAPPAARAPPRARRWSTRPSTRRRAACAARRRRTRRARST